MSAEQSRRSGGRRALVILLVVALVLSFLLFLAWKIGNTPESPFIYDL